MPLPPHQPTGIEAAVCEDITKRQQIGIAKYGTTVADNPLDLRQWLQHQYEELLDAAVYTKRAIAEIDTLFRSSGFGATSAELFERVEQNEASRLRLMALLGRIDVELQGTAQGRALSTALSDAVLSMPRGLS